MSKCVICVLEGGERREASSPLLPLDVLLPYQTPQIRRQGSSRQANTEFSPLVNCVILSFDDEVGERVDEDVVGREGVENGRSGWLRGHGEMMQKKRCDGDAERWTFIANWGERLCSRYDPRSVEDKGMMIDR